MDAAKVKQEDDLDTVHFPPLSPGERVKCSYSDGFGLVVVGTAYTIKAVHAKVGPIDQIALLEVPGVMFPETLFDRLSA